MGAHGGAVDAEITGQFGLRREDHKQPRPKPTMAPAAEPVVDGCRGEPPSCVPGISFMGM